MHEYRIDYRRHGLVTAHYVFAASEALARKAFYSLMPHVETVGVSREDAEQ